MIAEAVHNSRYRFGFNGMEIDNEVYGEGGSYTTEFRQNDPRLGGRWWSIDPIVKSWESPYAGYANNPVYYIDPSGLDPGGTQSGDTQNPRSFTEEEANCMDVDICDGDYLDHGLVNSDAIIIRPEISSPEKTSEAKVQQILKKISGYGLTASKMTKEAFDRGMKYGKPYSNSMTTIRYEKSVLGVKILKPLLDVKVSTAGKWSKGLGYGTKFFGAVSILASGADMYKNGVSISNSLDAGMTIMALSPSFGVGQTIAGGYFIINGGLYFVTGRDIGQWIEVGIENNNDRQLIDSDEIIKGFEIDR